MFIFHRVGSRSLIVAAILSAVALTAAANASAVYTPAVGSAERTAILKTLHAGDGDSPYRITFSQFRVFRDGQRSIAYVAGDGAVGEFQTILTRKGDASWRRVWGEGAGGSNSCADGARHFAWALRLIKTYGVAPDTLFPGLTEQTRDLKDRAKIDPEVQCVGDLDGGPL